MGEIYTRVLWQEQSNYIIIIKLFLGKYVNQIMHQGFGVMAQK